MSATRPLFQRIASKTALFVERRRMRRSPSGQIDGMWVGVCDGDNDAFTLAFTRVEQLLSLINVHDPIRYARMLRDLDHIWVTLLPGTRARFQNALKSCDLDERFLVPETTTLEEIASAIVHEATHARLMRCGIGYEPELRARVERVCIRRQRAFAAKLPNGEQVKAEADWALTEVPSDYWTDEARRDRAIHGAVDNLRFVGAPEIVIRAALGLAALVARVRNRRKS